MSCALFASDTTTVGMSGEIYNGMRTVKSVRINWKSEIMTR